MKPNAQLADAEYETMAETHCSFLALRDINGSPEHPVPILIDYGFESGFDKTAKDACPCTGCGRRLTFPNQKRVSLAGVTSLHRKELSSGMKTCAGRGDCLNKMTKMGRPCKSCYDRKNRDGVVTSNKSLADRRKLLSAAMVQVRALQT